MEIFKEEQRNSYSGETETTQLKIFTREFEQLGCNVERQGEYLRVTFDGQQCYLLETETSFTSLVGFRMLKNKTAARELFKQVGVNYAEGFTFHYAEKPRALKKIDQLGVAVVKPANGRKGAGVSVNVTKPLFDDAWESAARFSDEIIVETCFQGGIEARYFVIEGQCVAVHSRKPPSIVGNGEDSIEALVHKKNQNKIRCNPTRKNAPILLDSHRINLLKEKGLTPQSIPAKHERILIDWKAGISTGGDTENISDYVHPSMKHIAEKIAQCMPGLDVIGVDILARDHRNEASSDNYIVIEANTRPGTRGHVFPDFGQSINVCRLVAENCVRRLIELNDRRPAQNEQLKHLSGSVAGIACERWTYNEWAYFRTAIDHYDAVLFIDGRDLDFYRDHSGRTTGVFYKGHDLTQLRALYPFDQSQNVRQLIACLEENGCRIATYPDAMSNDYRASLNDATEAWRLYFIDNTVVGGYKKVRRRNDKFRAEEMDRSQLAQLTAFCTRIDLGVYKKGAFALDFVRTNSNEYSLASATYRPRLPDFQRVTGKSFADLVHKHLRGDDHLIGYEQPSYCMTLLGDTNPGETYQQRNEEKGDKNILKERGYDNGFATFFPILKTSNYTILNLEACITPARESILADIKPYLDWTDVEKTPELLRRMNVDAVCLANNHAYDFGNEGLADSLGILKTYNISPFGAALTEEDAAKPIHHRFQLGGLEHHVIVMTGFEYRKNHDDWSYYARNEKSGVNDWANKKAAEQVSRMRDKFPNAIIIAFPHWGSNYSYKSRRQERLAKTVIDAGASLIVGHGSHMMQEIEEYNKRTIIYGIGNFVFNSPGRFKKFHVDPFGSIVQLKFFVHHDALRAYIDLYPIWTDNRASDYNTSFVDSEGWSRFLGRFMSHRSPDNWLVRNSICRRDRFGYHLRLYPELH